MTINNWDSQGNSEEFASETVCYWVIRDKHREEDLQREKLKLAKRVMEILEEVYGVIDNPDTDLVNIVLAQELKPIKEQWDKLRK